MTLLQVLFSFEGRIGRTTWWISQIVAGVLGSILCVLLAQMMKQWALALLLPIYWITLATTTKRLHDLGKSGWWQGLIVVAIGLFIVGFIAMLGLPGKQSWVLSLPFLAAGCAVVSWATYISVQIAFFSGTTGVNGFGPREPLNLGGDREADPIADTSLNSDTPRTASAVESPVKQARAPAERREGERRQGFGLRNDGTNRRAPQSFGRRAPA